MNKVWLVIESVPYEGETIMGVYDSEEKAKDCRKSLQSSVRPWTVNYHVEEWEVK